jgi:hypothetical protein
MEYREFGKTGKRISRLGLGAMRLPHAKGRVDLEATAALIARALALGINIIDTAYVYPGSEEAIGRAIAGRADRAEFLLQTKSAASDRPGMARRRLEESLGRLRTEYVDFLLVHDARLEKLDEIRLFLAEARQAQSEGLVRHIGFSSHDTPTAVLGLIDLNEFECLLVQYNLLDTNHAAPIAHGRLKGLGVSVMGPLAGGSLARFDAVAPDAGDGAGVGAALRFVFANDNVQIAFSGVNCIDHLDEDAALAADAHGLSEEERLALELTATDRKILGDAFCTYCGYCMPCPNGVNIPEIFRLAQQVRLHGVAEHARDRYGIQVKLSLGADQCMRCGDCEPKCPQALRVCDHLAESHALLGGSPTPKML